MSLRAGELDVTALCDALGCSQSRTSQQLALLRKEGVVVPRRDGRRVYYRLADARTVDWAVSASSLGLRPEHLRGDEDTAA
jgi:DNA-binding transcriptional ArsR family regulator